MGHSHTVLKVLDHQLVIGRIVHIHPAVHLRVQAPPPQLAHDPACSFELVVGAKPAIDVDAAAHRGMHVRLTRDAHRMVDGLLRQMRELAVVDGNVRLPPSPAESVARRTPGTSASICASTCCMCA